MMKTMLLFVALLSAVALSSSSATTASGVAKSKERGVATFNEPVQLMGVELKGEYLFVHDNAAMARGETCTFVYKGTAELSSKLVISFHCTPELRNKVASFTVRTKQLVPGINEIEEIQFGGTTEAHKVPTLHFHGSVS
jgi:hypothetical protein